MSDSLRLRPRKLPRQTRSRQTVDAILAATARVLVDEGYDEASTNRIAEVAGVSVGSLYQYFPNKQSLVMSLIDRHRDRMLGVLAGCTATDEPRLDGAVARYVDTVLDAHGLAPELLVALSQPAHQFGMPIGRALEGRCLEIARGMLQPRRRELAVADLELAALFVVTTVQAVAQRVAGDRHDRAGAKVAREELCRLVTRYLRGA